MVPSAFVVLDALPLTPNGKIDRKALPPLDRDRAGPDETFVAPRTPVEQVLADIWAEVLGVDQVGVDDNFFTLGGHSLLITQIVSRVREVFPLEIPVQSLFETPTVAELARRIEATGREIQLDVVKVAEIFIRLSQLADDDIQTMLAERSDT
jgi:acyl carrier protein